MKPIETTERDVLGCRHTFAVRHGISTDRVFLAEAGPDSGCGSSRGVFGPEAAAIDRIEMPMN